MSVIFQPPVLPTFNQALNIVFPNPSERFNVPNLTGGVEKSDTSHHEILKSISHILYQLVRSSSFPRPKTTPRKSNYVTFLCHFNIHEPKPTPEECKTVRHKIFKKGDFKRLF